MDYDINNDGKVSDQELEVHEFHRETVRWQTQRRMAWVAMGSMIAYTAALFIPFVPDARAHVLVEIAPLFYVAQAGVVGAYMGSKAAVDKNLDTKKSGPRPGAR